MFIRKLVIMAGISLLVTGCATDGVKSNFYAFNSPAQTSDKGVKYLLGHGVPQSDEKAFYYFSKAAERGDPYAQNEVAYMYATGKGTPRDKEKAFIYYQQAANSGVASAQYSLGQMYLRGIGTSKNNEKALEWFKKSADAGFEPAEIAVKRYA